MQVKISKRLYRAEITYFKINIICFLQVDCMWRNSLLINVHVQTIKQKLSNSNGKTFKFHFSCLFFFFISPRDCRFRSSKLNNTFLYQNEGGGNSHKNINIPFPFKESSVTLVLPAFKNRKNPEVDKKIQVCKTLTLTKGFVFSSCRCSKQSVSRLFVYLF